VLRCYGVTGLVEVKFVCGTRDLYAVRSTSETSQGSIFCLPRPLFFSASASCRSLPALRIALIFAALASDAVCAIL